ncbi:Peroxidase 72 [Glycine soja]|uniref:peroxidase n=2 Tax=Glycine subgen. Soja TaxID=1462606 RepID=K7K6K0_SOYBN|nr:Peroxidase 72 [Glycine soja]
MANSMSFLLLLSLLAFAPLCLCNPNLQFYNNSCPQAQLIVKSILTSYFVFHPGYAAQILSLHFHDYFGCDGSVLLDSSESIVNEKESNNDRDSLRGFIRECPSTVSCADILTIAASDSVVLTGGPSWLVSLGRRDSRDASISGSNNNIPASNCTFQILQTKFEQQGLNITDLVALSGILLKLCLCLESF